METIFFKNLSKNDLVVEVDEKVFHIRSVIGGLQWLANQTRFDISYATNTVARFQERTSKKVFIVVSRIVRYLSATADYGLYYSKTEAINDKSICITGWCDANFARDTETMKSVGSYCFKLSNLEDNTKTSVC